MGRFPKKLRPMGPMGWDGMGLSDPTRSPGIYVRHGGEYLTIIFEWAGLSR